MNYFRNNFFKEHLDLFILIPVLMGLLIPFSIIDYGFLTAIIILELLFLVIVGYIILKYKHHVLYLLAFLIPLSIPTKMAGGAMINFPSEAICILLAVYVIIKSLFNLKISKALLFHPITILLMLDVLWLIITSSIGELKDVAFKRTLIRILYIVVYYYFFNELFKTTIKSIFTVFLLHTIGIIYPIIHTTIFHSQFNFSSQGSTMASLPFYNDHTIYGAALAMFIPFSIFYFIKSIKEKSSIAIWFSAILLALLLLGEALSYSRAAWLSLILATVLFVVLKTRIKLKYIISVSVVFILAIILSWNTISEYVNRNKEISHKNDIGAHFKSVTNVNTDASNTERLNRWKCAWRMFSDKPLFGFGPGSYQFFYGRYQQRKDMTAISTFKGNKGHAHSEYLNYLSETGLIGMLNFMALIILTFYFGIKVIYTTRDNFVRNTTLYVILGFFTYVVHAFFNGFIETDKIAMPFFVCISAIVALDIKNKSLRKSDTIFQSLP